MNVRLEDGGLNRFDKIVRIANLNPTYCFENDTIQDVISKIILSGHRRVPIVLRNGSLVGIITYMDILDAILREQDLSSKISTIMVRDIILCNADDTIVSVLQKFKLSRRGGLPIVKNKKLVGIVNERDFVKYFSNVTIGPVHEIMTPKPFFIKKNISILDCLKTMVNTRYRRLPMMENGKLVGIATALDVLKYTIEHNYDIKTFKEPVDFIARHDVYTITTEEDASDVIKLMKKNDIGGVVVVNKENKLAGIITERDILERIV